MADFTTYTTKDNDRWDLIAWKAYGDASRYIEIAAANRNVPLYPVLPSGITLRVPIANPETLDVNNLPPWKR